MVTSDLLATLIRIVGDRHVQSGTVGRELYSYDGSLATAFPGAVVFPGTTAETAEVVKALAQAKVPCIARGFGTNLSGGSIALQDGVVVGLSRLSRILEIRPEKRMARVQSGITNLEVQNALAPLGYYFAPDPSSQKVSTIGGNIGENSGGPHCLKYGVTTNHILGLEVVLADGSVVTLGGPGFEWSGPDLRGLMVGSEGTLGIVTEAYLRIQPKAESVVTMLAVYDSIPDAARSVSDIISSGITPATLEMMDAVIIKAVEDSMACGYPRDAAAVLIIEVEGPEAGLRARAEKIRGLCMARGCRAVREAANETERAQLWAGRRGAFGAIARLAPNYLVADCTVPRTRLPEALEAVAAITKKHGFLSGNVFHAGDGNLHPLLLFDARDASQLAKVHAAAMEITEACVKLGGTITGEHGVGMEKIEAMRLIFSEDDLTCQRTIRTAFDPLGLFNPGKIFPEPRETGAFPPSAASESSAGDWTPANAKEACDCIRAAIAGKIQLLPAGQGRRADYGNYTAPETIRLRSAKLSGVVEYDPQNQVAVLGAGLSLAAAQALLAKEKQWIPLRPPLLDRCTLGGTVALGAFGPERACYGAPRDLLLGLQFVTGTGTRAAAGGKVVKNVAGYDLTRLMAGSTGNLGFLTALNFRVAAVPETCRAVRGQGTLAQCATAAALLLNSRLEPVFVTAILRKGAADWEFKAGFEGFDDTLQAQVRGCAVLMEQAGFAAHETSDYPLLEGAHGADFSAIYNAEFTACADLPVGSTAAYIEGCREPLAGAAILADFACGRVTAGLRALSGDGWAALCARAGGLQGRAVLEKAPTEFKRGRDVFGPARPEWALMHRIKEAIDPRAVFAPGRLPGRK